MGNEQTKQELEVTNEPLTYFAINIKQPDKLHIVPSDSAVSSLVTRALQTHYRSVVRHVVTCQLVESI